VEVVIIAVRYLVGWLLVVASIPKLSTLNDFQQAVANYEILSPRQLPAFARGLPVLELVTGVALLVGLNLRLAGAIAATMFAGFSVAVVVNLLRGRRIDCGCSGGGGGATSREISWSLVGVNLLLICGTALIVAYPPDTLALMASWPGPAPETTVEAQVALAVGASVALLIAIQALIREYRDLWTAVRQ
jgi:Methylamine utilisation protein MauE